jgi:Eisosome protein 1
LTKADLDTYDIGGIVMTHEQVEAIAQKHVNEVLAEINEKVERERARIETEKIERETRLREKEHEKELARERAAEDKAEKDRIKAAERERKAEERRIKTESKIAEKKKKEEEKIAAKELKAVQREQLAVAEGSAQDNVQKHVEETLARRKEEAGGERALDDVQSDQADVVDGVLRYDAEENQEMRKEIEERVNAHHELAEVVLHPDTALDDDVMGHGIKSWLKEKKEKIGRRLSRAIAPESPTKHDSKEEDQHREQSPKTSTEKEGEEDLYGEHLPVVSKWEDSTGAREDSPRNVALAKHEDAENIERKTQEQPATGDHEVSKHGGTEENDDDEFKDAEEEVEPEEPATSAFGIMKESRKLSGERGSRFKEEF